jgi:tripartite-type tricarboxylate transporter receptor subunit TctC
VLDRLNRELVAIMKSPAFVQRVEPLGFEAKPTSLEEFARFNADEIKRWGDIVRAQGIKMEQ